MFWLIGCSAWIQLLLKTLVEDQRSRAEHKCYGFLLNRQTLLMEIEFAFE